MVKDCSLRNPATFPLFSAQTPRYFDADNADIVIEIAALRIGLYFSEDFLKQLRRGQIPAAVHGL